MTGCDFVMTGCRNFRFIRDGHFYSYCSKLVNNLKYNIVHHTAATLWNSLPNHFRTENSFSHFKSLINLSSHVFWENKIRKLTCYVQK